MLLNIDSIISDTLRVVYGIYHVFGITPLIPVIVSIPRHTWTPPVCQAALMTARRYLPERELQTDVGPVTIRIPKVCAKTGDPVTFRSALVPPYVRKTRSLEAALTWLYLNGVSNG